jgi:hypothetical protein
MRRRIRPAQTPFSRTNPDPAAGAGGELESFPPPSLRFTSNPRSQTWGFSLKCHGVQPMVMSWSQLAPEGCGQLIRGCLSFTVVVETLDDARTAKGQTPARSGSGLLRPGASWVEAECCDLLGDRPRSPLRDRRDAFTKEGSDATGRWSAPLGRSGCARLVIPGRCEFGRVDRHCPGLRRSACPALSAPSGRAR